METGYDEVLDESVALDEDREEGPAQEHPHQAAQRCRPSSYSVEQASLGSYQNQLV